MTNKNPVSTNQSSMTSLWDNFVTLKDCTFTMSDLDKINKTHHPKYFYMAEVDALKKNFSTMNLAEILEVRHLSNPSDIDIKLISDFMRHNFFEDNLDNYDQITDINKFYEQQKFYFTNETKNILHLKNEKVVAVITLCRFENHPYLKEAVWHVGYWGISKGTADRNVRTMIKSSWNTLQLELNAHSKLVVCTDYFNKPSYELAEKLGYKRFGIRLDSR